MGRRKTALALKLIPNEKSRKVTFRKRKNGLFKKARELTTLCDVKVCAIVYEKKPNGQLGQPETFPESSEEVNRILHRYKSNSSKVKRVLNLGDFFAKQTIQVKKEIEKLRSKNAAEKYPTWDDRINGFSLDQMIDLGKSLEDKGVASCKMSDMMLPNQETTMPPMALLQSNLEYSDEMHGWGQYASESWANSNIQYTSSSTASNSNSNYKDTTTFMWANEMFDNNTILQYGNYVKDEKEGFYNPVQSYLYDDVSLWFNGVASQQVVAPPSVEQPTEVVPLSLAYDEVELPLTIQPCYTQCPALAASCSFEYQQYAASQGLEVKTGGAASSQSYAADQVHMFSDSMFQYSK